MGLTKNAFLLLIFFFTQAISLTAQIKQPDPKREFRGVWIATVTNIDWPGNSRASSSTQIKELTDILDSHQKTGINAVMFQVRPAADALYIKSIEPWSQWLTGTQGKAPDPLYDPLEIAINEAHKRGIELHAWINPFRATFSPSSSVASNSIIYKKPEWFFTYGGQKIFNPGIPEVREYICKVILNIVDNYDIDGIHMDDYFYPYPIHGQKINDADAFKKYGSEYYTVDDWRRHNVDTMIQMLSDSIHHHKKYLKYGVSPLGIWRNKAQDPLGSDTRGSSTYSELYADTRSWVELGWLDYINPQVYWNINYKIAAFEKIIDWWSDNVFGRHLYIGQAPYRIIENTNPAFRLTTQLPDQMKLIRKNRRIQGSVFFSSKSVTKNPAGFTDSLRQNYYRYKALPPVMLWLDSIPPGAPQNLGLKLKPNAVTLTWEKPLPARDKEPVYGYVIYRFNEGEKIFLDDPKHILCIQYNTATTYDDTTVEKGKTYWYVVTAIDRLKNESYATSAESAKY